MIKSNFYFIYKQVCELEDHPKLYLSASQNCHFLCTFNSIYRDHLCLSLSPHTQNVEKIYITLKKHRLFDSKACNLTMHVWRVYSKTEHLVYACIVCTLWQYSFLFSTLNHNLAVALFAIFFFFFNNVMTPTLEGYHGYRHNPSWHHWVNCGR